MDTLKAQVASQDSAVDALRADNARLKKALAAREAAARHSEGTTPSHHDAAPASGAAPREVLAKLRELTCVHLSCLIAPGPMMRG
jgi:hypothetical protein